MKKHLIAIAAATIFASASFAQSSMGGQIPPGGDTAGGGGSTPSAAGDMTNPGKADPTIGAATAAPADSAAVPTRHRKHKSGGRGTAGSSGSSTEPTQNGSGSTSSGAPQQ